MASIQSVILLLKLCLCENLPPPPSMFQTIYSGRMTKRRPANVENTRSQSVWMALG